MERSRCGMVCRTTKNCRRTFEIEFYDAGHILGSASILVTCEEKEFFFGDLGNIPALFIKDTDILRMWITSLNRVWQPHTRKREKDQIFGGRDRRQ